MASYHIDILGLAEVNLKWNRFSTYDRLSQRTSTWWENSHCSYAYNVHDVSTSKFQPGGTAILSKGLLSNKALTIRNQDPTGLGRWTSSLYQGQENKKLRIIQVYRPCKPNPNSNNGVYQQHSRYLLQKNITTCPRSQFFQDLKTFIQECLHRQEQIIVMGDFNEDITQPSISSFFTSLHMHNLLHSLFNDEYLSSQCTFNRGTSILDGIFATQGIEAIRGGYLSDTLFESDHNPVWVDISIHSVFGNSSNPLTPHHCRRLKNEDPRVVQKFNNEYNKLLHKHSLHQDLHNLTQSIHSSITSTQIKEYERIDHLRVKCLLQAERKCRRLKTGNIEFSPLLQHQRDLIRFWKMIKKRKAGHKIDTRYLSRWERKLKLTDTFHTPLNTINSNIKSAVTQYLLLKKNHSSLRDEWIEQLAAAKAEAGDTNSATELQQLRQKEKMRQAHRQIKWCLHHENMTGPITEVTEISNTQTIKHTDKCSVEQAIIKANDKKYRQTNDTPPMTTLLPLLGRYGTTKAARQILDGSFNPPIHIDNITKNLLTHFQIPQHIKKEPLINTEFTTQNYIQGWSKMRERTSSGLSTIHFGHHLACTKHYGNATFEAKMCSLPYQKGFSPQRYQTSINAMLLKKAGRTDVDSLRTIVLLEPDFNFMNKKLGRDVMFQAEKHHLIAPEQFGSRKKHSSIDQVLIKTLYYDTLRIKKQDGFLCSNDAKACYDRITHSIASLALQRVGLPPGPIISMFQSLQNMRHHIRTGYGVSTSSYGKSLQQGKPVQGSGQGNGASPSIWVLMSTPLLNMMRKENYGAHFISPLSKEKTHFVGCSFVDDTDLVYSSFNSEDSLEDLAPIMQQAINTWEGGLRATGGALVPEKSWIYPIKYVWNNKGDATLEDITSIDINFTLKNSNQELKPLQLTPPTHAKETLGVFLAPNGSNDAQIQYLQNKVLHWAEKIRTHHISPQNALLSIHSTILSTLKYPAPALSLSRNDWQKITAPLYQVGLQASGICNKLPKPLRNGTYNNLGLQIPCMFLTQGIQKLIKYISFIESQSILGKMLRICEEYTKLDLGSSGNLYTTPYHKTHFLTSHSWIKNLWKFVYEHKILLLDRSPHLTLSSDKDILIMDLFLQGNFKKRELITLNKCRKYLKILSVGDMLTGNGQYVSKAIKYGQRYSFSSSTMHWPNQEDPGAQAWSLWRRAIKKMIEIDNKVSPEYQPTKWKESPHRRYNWYYNRGLDRIFQRANDNKWNFYARTMHRGRRRRHPTFHYRGVLNSLPSNSTPASITNMSVHTISFTGTLQQLPHTTPATLHTSLSSYINALPTHNLLLSDLSQLDNLPHIINSIKNGNCALVSDGSYYQSTHKAAAAFILGNEAAHRRIIGRCHIIGPKESFSAYRSELAGIHCGLMFIHCVCSVYNIQAGRLVVACDNNGVIQRITKRNVKPQDQHFDYLSGIEGLLADLKITINFSYVDGHKDKLYSLDNLSTLESMNVSADLHAKVKADSPTTPHFAQNAEIYKEWAPIKLVQNDGSTSRIHSSLDRTIYEFITTQPSRDYWNKKMRIPQEISETINWQSLGSAFSELHPNKKKEVIKWNSGFCGTNAALFQRKQAMSAECPGCKHPLETTVHILRCPANGAKTSWDDAIDTLQKWLERKDAAPELAQAIIQGLNSWRNNTPMPRKRYSLPHLQTAIAQQNIIGWRGFIHGFISKHWEYAQSLYLQFISKRTTGKRWITSLIKKLWETIWSIWRYRNGLVHAQTNSPLHKITALLNISILKELQIGLDNLPPKYSYLFKMKMSQVLKTSLNQKKQWIITVWVARDTYTPLHISTTQRNPIITSILTAWKHRIHQYESHQNSSS